MFKKKDNLFGWMGCLNMFCNLFKKKVGFFLDMYYIYNYYILLLK